MSSQDPEFDVPLPVLFHTALIDASRASELRTVDDETQELIQKALANLRVVTFRITSLSLFSPNESLEDIATADLVYLLVPFVLAEVQGRVRAYDRDERMMHLMRAQAYLRIFLTTLDDYDVVPNAEKELHNQRTSNARDPTIRRELKIKQFQKEKELKARIKTLQQRRGRTHTEDEALTNFQLIASLLPSTVSSSDDNDNEQEELARETTLLLLRLHWAEAQTEMESMKQELQLLHSAPPEGEQKRQTDVDRSGDNTWKLDPLIPREKGPLIDSAGKPLRPFTILPSNVSSERARLQAEVFRPDHRLPSMSIDEYLEEDQRRGNIISGGGPASALAPTSSEQLAIDSEMDGTRFGEERNEVKRQKDEQWTLFTEANPRGAGNTMNRG